MTRQNIFVQNFISVVFLVEVISYVIYTLFLCSTIAADTPGRNLQDIIEGMTTDGPTKNYLLSIKKFNTWVPL